MRVSWTTWNGKGVSLYLRAADAVELQKALGAANTPVAESGRLGNAASLRFPQCIHSCHPLLRIGRMKIKQLRPADEFTKRITMSEISVYPDGTLEFSYRTHGGLFGDHWLVISASLSEGPTYADMMG